MVFTAIVARYDWFKRCGRIKQIDYNKGKAINAFPLPFNINMQLKIRSVSKSFGQIKANDDVDVIFPSGKVIALLGENGAGKSTLMKIVSGFLHPDSGSIFLDEDLVDVSTPSDALHLGIGMLHQDPLVFPPMTIRENLLLGLAGKKSEFLSLCEEIALRFGFQFNLDLCVSSLTIGECQQVEIVRLLAHGVSLLILDEPTTGISAQQKRTLFAAIRALTADGKTVIFVTHKLDDANRLCDQAVIMRRGKVVAFTTLPCTEDKLVKHMFGKNFPKIPLCHEPQPTTVLSVNQLTYDERSLRVKNVSFAIQKGEVIGLAGIEGSGQKGLLRALSGYKPITGGKIIFEDEDISHLSFQSLQRMGIRLLPADRLGEGLISGLSIAEHSALVSQTQHFVLDEANARKIAQEKIQKYNIKGDVNTLAGQLSGGNQQRLMLSLLSDASKLLLLEHPTRGLDIESALAVWKVLQQQCQEGTSIIFTSAELDEILEYCDRIFVFYEGRLSSPIVSRNTSVNELGLLIGGKGF